MDQKEYFELNGKIYRQTRGGRWVDDSCMQVTDPSTITKLNEMALALQGDTPFHTKYEQAIQANKSGDYDLARLLSQGVLESDAPQKHIEAMFPLYIAALRHVGQSVQGSGSSTSRAAIEGADEYLKRCPYLRSSTRALTSLAACWADLAEHSSIAHDDQKKCLKRARDYANQANAINRKKGIEDDMHLMNVYKRLKRLDSNF